MPNEGKARSVIITTVEQAMSAAQDLALRCQVIRAEINGILDQIESLPGNFEKRERLLELSRELERADSQIKELTRAIREYQAARTTQPEDRP